MKKPTCAGMVSDYKACDTSLPQYSGTEITVGAGDKVAMNSMLMTIVEIDGNGNGFAKIIVPAMNKVKLNVALEGIKVAEGNCITAGKAVFTGVDVDAKYLEKLKMRYDVFTVAMAVGEAGAGVIAETYNNINEKIAGLRNKMQTLIDKIDKNEKISKSEESAYKKLNEEVQKDLNKTLDLLKKKFGNSTEAAEVAAYIQDLTNPCEIPAENKAPPSTSKGPSSPEVFFTLPDAKACLVGKKTKSASLEAILTKAKSLMKEEMQCGCAFTSMANVIKSLKDNRECESVIEIVNGIKSSMLEGTLYEIKIEPDIFDAMTSRRIGQVSIGDMCVNNFKIELPRDYTVIMNGLVKDDYDVNNRYISNNKLTVYTDKTQKVDAYAEFSLEDQSQAKIFEKWLFPIVGGAAGKVVKPKEDEPNTTSKFPITGKQLKEIFKGTSQNRCDDVAKLINKYSDKYGIDNASKMSHFIGQVGAETNLSQLKELTYTAKNIEDSDFATTTRKYKGKEVLKYCDLFEGYDGIGTSLCPFPYCEPPLYVGTTGLKAKSKYVKNTALFDYVYACRMENGTIDSNDGSRFRGRGFIQLTGHYNYRTMLQEKWDKVHGKGNKDFLCRSAECDKNLEMIADDLDMAMQTALTFWADANANDYANDISDNGIKKVTYEVNGGYNGLSKRREYTKKAYKILKK